MRICSLLPSGTEILFALGLGDQVVGVTDLCDYPPEARSKRIICRSLIDPTYLTSDEVEKRVQELLASDMTPFVLDIEWLNSEGPELILTQDVCYNCDVHAKEVSTLKNVLLAQSRILVLSPRRFFDLFDDIRTVGDAAGVPDRAESLLTELEERARFIAEKASKAAHKPRVFSLEGVNPLVAGGHWLPEMKALAGGKDDVFPPGCPAQRLSWQEVVEAAPEVLVIALCSSPIQRSLREIAWLVKQEGWWELPAVKNGEVYVVDHVYFSRPGPRLIKGLGILAEILHPELFSGLIPHRAVVKLDTVSAGDRLPDEPAHCFHPYPSDSGKAPLQRVGG